MISLELAQKLKDAGLGWEPKPGDIAIETDIAKNKHELGIVRCLAKGENFYRFELTYLTWGSTVTYNYCCLWLPRLDQLLTEIEARGYLWSLHRSLFPEGEYTCEVAKIKGGYMDLPSKTLNANNSEDATARALIWLLERGKADE